MGVRFSGHESFPCRYAWLPKAFAEIQASADALADDEQAMIALGLGKNMVRAVRFWLQVTGVATPGKGGTFTPTDFGKQILARRGSDPFLEDIRTLWLLHWQITSQVTDPLFAWDFLFNRWPKSEFSRSAALDAFRREAKSQEKSLSDVTLEQHFDVFLHTYVPTRGRKGVVVEDNLDCPLVELQLIERVGERSPEEGHREAVYAFKLDDKPEITPELFAFCLNDFWTRRHPDEATLTLREVVLGAGSPGQLMKLPEPVVRERLEHIHSDSEGAFSYRESASLQQITRGRVPRAGLLARVFDRETANV